MVSHKVGSVTASRQRGGPRCAAVGGCGCSGGAVKRDDMTWEKLTRWVKRWIPSGKIVHPYPNQRFAF
jgi:hypothetical protein